MMTAFFPGSFDPFTVGHQSVVERIRPLFGRIVIGIGVNKAKKRWQPVDDSIQLIRNLFADDCDIDVVAYDCLTTEAASKVGADVIVKGIRSIADYEYELRQADINRHLSGIETLFIPALPEMAAVSSSIVRELSSYGTDINELLPNITESKE